VVGPPPEAIGEMQIMTSGYNAEYGRAAGGVVNVNLKSGTNSVHGTLWEIFQDQSMDANRWENNLAGKPRGVFKQNQFGAAVGGPIIKNRTFVFGDYQGTRLSSTGGAISGLGFTGYRTIPTPQQVNGDFSQFVGAQIGTGPLGGILQGQIFDPASIRTVNGSTVRDAFPGNVIPRTRFDPAAAKIAALYPAANQPISNVLYPQNDYFSNTLGTLAQDSGDLRVDHTFSENDKIYGSLSWSDRHNISHPPFPGLLDGSGFSAASENSLSRNAQIGYTSVWTARIISETRVAFSRLVTSRYQAEPILDAFKQFGIGGYNSNGQGDQNGGLFSLSLGRYTAVGGGSYIPSLEYSNVWNFIQNVAINKGSHSMKFGAEYRTIAFPFFQFQYSRGSMTFAQNGTAYPSTATSTAGGTINTVTGDEFASFLLGNVDQGNIGTTNFESSEKKVWAGYAQDDWKITPRLTVNIGIRYELFTPIGERLGRQSNFDWPTLTLYIPKGKDQNAPLPSNFAATLPFVKVSRGEVDKYMVPWDKWDIGPRIGIAYNYRAKTVIRLGFGIFYSGEQNQGAGPSRGNNVPFNEAPGFTRVGLTNFDYNPAFPRRFAGGFPADPFSYPVAPAFTGVDYNFKNGMVQKWNLALQRELPKQMSLELGYTGNHQAHSISQWSPNQAPNSPNTRLIPVLTSVSSESSFGFGNYNAGTMKLEKRMAEDGLQFIASYTFSHTLVNIGTPLSGGGITRTNPFDYATGYGNAGQDIRHSWTTGFTWEIPFGKGKTHGGSMGRTLNAVVGNWQTNGILSLRTGQPYSITSNYCIGLWSVCLVDTVPGKNPYNAPPEGRSPDKWFDTSAVAKPAAGTFGNLGQNILVLPAHPDSRFFPFQVLRNYGAVESPIPWGGPQLHQLTAIQQSQRHATEHHLRQDHRHQGRD
jgi:hypothetical protein